MRLVQLTRSAERRAGVVEGERIALLNTPSVYALAQEALRRGTNLSNLAAASRSGEFLQCEDVSAGEAGWRWLPCADHPVEPARCLVSGTGLTHASSAKNRQAMHARAEDLSDSMRMYLWGVERGRPLAGEIGVAPEWFYKGTGAILRAHLEPLQVPWYADDGGEEPEVAGVYLIDTEGRPRRLGMAQGNEFSDHVHERKNYLYLAESKLRTCAIGPELWLDPEFDDVRGEVFIERSGGVLWRKEIRSGEAAMSHSLANMEHHHFKHAQHRRPGDLHVHFYGADAFSFGDGISLQDGDMMVVSWRGFGMPLRNPIQREHGGEGLLRVEGL